MYVNVPIEPEHLAHVRETMQAHGATVLKIRREPEDHWWHIFLPEGTTQVEKASSKARVRKYDILFPDGYRFEYEAGRKNRDGLFTRDPVISLDKDKP